MRFHHSEADVFVPDGEDLPAALERTTHLCIGAHQDDQEFMAYHGIVDCFGRADRWFAGVVVTNGGGSARTDVYADHTDEEMMAVRRREQRKAAYVGEYACQIQLAYASAEAKDPQVSSVAEDLRRILEIARPEVVYLHNPADKHDTHVACALRSIDVLRALPAEAQPRKVYGCEVWRDLDWLLDEDKEVLRVDRHENLATSLGGVFDSQLIGGKRYDLAIAGRRRAHATMFESHAVDETQGLTWAMDLTPLIDPAGPSVLEHTLAFVDRFREDVIERTRRLGGA